MTGWIGRPATEIAAAVRSGQVSARQVVAEHLDRIAAIDGQLGAFVRVRSAEAMREADEVDARPDRAELPLAGVPVAIKDNIPVAGEPMRMGSLATPDAPQASDHPVVARLRAAGAIVLGLTSLPELTLFPFTDSGFGIARNPWDTKRTPGGSSGGAGAAVAAAMVPIAHGNDALGSIRIPAAACGLAGIKPTPDLIPADVGADSWDGLCENGPLASTVADLALALGVMAGAPLEPVSPDGLRVAVSVRAPGPGVIVHRGLKDVARQCGELLASLGHVVTSEDPPYPLWSTPAMIGRWLTALVPDAEPYLTGPRAAGASLERRTRRHIRAGQFVLRIRRPRPDHRERLRAAFGPYFERHDVLVMPSLALPCPAARRWGEGSWLRSVLMAVRFSPMTGVWNMAGYPAASVPFGTVSGLPGAVQLIAAPGREAALLALAARIETAAAWRRHAPEFDPAG